MDAAAFLGGFGIGGLLTTLVYKWLDVRSERSRWLRDRRHAAHSALAKELLSMGVWTGTMCPVAASAIAAEAILLLDDKPLATRIAAFVDDVGQTQQRIKPLAGELHEYPRASQTEHDRLKTGARAIVDALRQEVLR